MPWDFCCTCSCPSMDCTPRAITYVMQNTPPNPPTTPAHQPCDAPLDPPAYALPTSRGRPHPPEMQRYLIKDNRPDILHKQLKKYENDRKAEDVGKT